MLIFFTNVVVAALTIGDMIMMTGKHDKQHKKWAVFGKRTLCFLGLKELSPLYIFYLGRYAKNV